MSYVLKNSRRSLRVDGAACAQARIKNTLAGTGSEELTVKEGKVRIKDSQMLPGGDESLLTLVTANTMENVKIAVEKKHPEARYRYP